MSSPLLMRHQSAVEGDEVLQLFLAVISDCCDRQQPRGRLQAIEFKLLFETSLDKQLANRLRGTTSLRDS